VVVGVVAVAAAVVAAAVAVVGLDELCISH
jgi:hypothetical protein